MADYSQKTKEELIKELQELQQAHNALKDSAEADSIAQKQTLEALQASEERFQLLFNKAPLGYQSLDFDGNFTEVNQQWLDTLGYEREEVIGKWFGDFLTPVFKDGFRKRFPIFKERGKIHSEFEMIHKNGSVLFIAFDGRIGYDVKGDFKQTHCILQDLTSAKQAEQELLAAKEKVEESEKRFRNAIECSPIPTAIAKNDGELIFLNKQFVEIYGYTLQEIPSIGKWFELAYPDIEYRNFAVNDWGKEIENSIKNNVPTGYKEYQITCKNGKIKTVAFSAYFEKDISVGLFQDITERRQAEEKQHESELRFKVLFDDAPDAMFLADPESGKIVDVNNGACLLFKKQRSELIGLFQHELHPPQNIDYSKSSFKTQFEENSPTAKIKPFEKAILCSDGTEIPVEILGSSIQIGDKMLMLGTFRNITKRKQAEEKLKHQNELFDSLIKNLPMGVFMVEAPSGKPLLANEAALNLLGRGILPDATSHDLVEVYKAYKSDIEHPYPVDKMPIIRGMNGEYSQIDDMLIVRPDDTETVLEIFGSPVMNENGEVWASLVSFHDISERKQLEKVHTFLSSSFYSGSDMNFFKSLAKYLAEILDSEYVCIDKLVGDGLTAQTVAIYNEGKFDPNLAYTLKQTPCGDVVGKTICCFPENVCQLFPHDEALQDLKAHSYIGTTLWSFDGKPIGLIAIIGQKPLKNAAFAENVLKLVAIRAAGELERMQAEEDLRENERKYRTLFETADDAILLFTEGVWTDCNSGALKVFGCAREQIIGSHPNRFSPPMQPDGKNSEEEAIKKINLAFAGEPQYFEWLHCKWDGALFEAEVKFNRLYLEGKPYIQAMVIDISERKQSEKALIKSEERYALVIEASEQGIWDWNVETNDVFYSEQWKRQIGYKDHELKNDFNTWVEHLHPDEREFCQDAVSSYLSHPDKNFILEFRFRHKDGTYRWIHNKAASLKNNDGKVIRMFGAHTDITEKRQLDEALRRSEAIKNTMVSNIGDVIVIIDQNGINQYKSPNIATLFGWQPEELVGKSTWDNVHADDLDAARKFIATLTTEPNAKGTTEIRYKRKDGSYVWIEITVANLLSNPDINGLLGNYHDITERKLAEEELKSVKASLELCLEASQIGIWSHSLKEDPEHIKEVSVRDLKHDQIFGYKEKLASWGQEKMLKHVIDEDREATRKAFDNVFEKGRLDFECRINWPDNTIHWIACGGKVYKDSAGQPNQINGTVMDITERKLAEQELIIAKDHAENNNRINEARLKLIQFSENHTIDEVLEETLNLAEIISQSKIGFVHYVEQDQTNLLLQNWSTGTKQHYCNAKGLGFHYPIEKAGVWVDCITDRKPVIHNNYEALKHKKGLPEGHAALIRELVVPIIYDGNVKAIFGIGNKETDYNQIDVENISLLAYLAWEIVEKKKISEALVFAKEKAEESDRLKSAFLANMSHEIRTPMNGILGFAELLKEPGLSGDEQQKYIRIIEKSGARMLNIINDIIDISKIQSGLIKINLVETNINELVEYIYTFFKPEVEAKGIKLSFKTTLSAKEATILTDREKVYAILTNLVKNAIKYTKEGSIDFGYVLKGTVELPDNAISPMLIEFYVKDTGIGIPLDRQDAIFERFIQADIEDKMARQGAGLGLTITKNYVRMLGGKIWVESQEGKGSVFYFTLPYNALSAENKIIKNSIVAVNTKIHVTTLKIMLAEDDEVSEQLLQTTVEMFGKEIINARTGTEAVKLCRQNPDIDLILMDIRMPELSGYEATRLIREFNKNVVIIAQTAYGLSGDREKAIEAGCNDYISKPINKIELLALIQKYFGE
jgi:PAS domain S-box-containing protein